MRGDHWTKSAKVITGSGSGPVTSVHLAGDLKDVDFVPALRSILGEEPGPSIISDLHTLLKLTGPMRLEMIRAAVIHLAIAETYKDLLRDAMGESFSWRTMPDKGPSKDGAPT